MDSVLVFGVATAILLGIAISIRRSGELFVLQVEGGRLRLRRGRMPPRLWSDLEDIVRHAGIQDARITVVRERGQPRVVAPGVDDAAQQQLRNVVGTYSLAKLRAGQRRA